MKSQEMRRGACVCEGEENASRRLRKKAMANAAVKTAWLRGRADQS